MKKIIMLLICLSISISDSEQPIILENSDEKNYLNGYKIEEIKAGTLVKKISNSVLSDYKIHFAGQPYLTGETPSLIKEDVQKLMLIGVIIMIAILIFNLRSIYAVLCVFCIIFLALG